MQTIDIKEKDGTITQYVEDHNGVIKQLYPVRYPYDAKYVSTYDTPAYQARAKALQLIRMGFVQSFMIDRPVMALLDVGYGNGAFLKEAKNTFALCYGYDVTGLPVPDGCTQLRTMYDERVDVVTFWDVLEHFPDLTFLGYMQHVTDLIVVSLPWCHVNAGKNFDWFVDWKHRKPNEHLHHFNSDSLKKTFKQFGWDCLGITNIEDAVRTPVDQNKNILSAAFRWVG